MPSDFATARDLRAVANDAPSQPNPAWGESSLHAFADAAPLASLYELDVCHNRVEPDVCHNRVEPSVAEDLLRASPHLRDLKRLCV